MIIPDLSDKYEVKVKDTVFSVRALPTKTYRSLISRLSFLREMSNKVTKESFESLKAQDPQKYEEVNEKLHEVFRDFIKQSVVGHTGITKKDGSDVPFVSDEKDLVSDETLDAYERLHITYILASEVIALNTMTGQDLKN
jgi:hypothetical protein